MLGKTLIAIIASSLASKAAAVPPSGHTYTDIMVYHTIIEESPFMVDRTTTVVWTQGPSVTPSAQMAVHTNQA